MTEHALSSSDTDHRHPCDETGPHGGHRYMIGGQVQRCPGITAPAGPLPPEELPPYSGDDVQCPKCRNVGASTRYRAAGEHGENDRRTWGPSPKGERLERECSRCDYTWDEALAVPDDEDRREATA